MKKHPMPSQQKNFFLRQFFFCFTIIVFNLMPLKSHSEIQKTTELNSLTNDIHSELKEYSSATESLESSPIRKNHERKNLSLKEKLKALSAKSSNTHTDNLIFDLPVTYNKKVSKWISFYQTNGNRWFRTWLEKSYKFMPFIQRELKESGLPADLAYMVMIESGFSAQATSTANAAGPWQFIKPTGTRYGLAHNWWLDERRDLKKSTQAAIKYLKDLYDEFGSWYLVAASYNMGENGLRRQINKYNTKDYWTLIKLSALPVETQEYVPKILAAMLISKAPNLYGFRDLEKMDPLVYEVVLVSGGLDLDYLADYLGITRKSLKDLNAELFLGYIPREVGRHYIRVPKGASRLVAEYVYNKNQRSNIR